jgi:crotonobetainyl-CoA:carnitine CoA-transferase CaiB-like acyl-CoA transferase
MMRRQMDLLAGTRFTVASYGPAAAFSAWLLRSFGASVAHTTALDPEGLGAFLGDGATAESSPPLDAAANLTFVTDVPFSAGNRARLSELAETRRVIWITPWGCNNEWSDRPSSDLALYAASGWMSAVGDPAREPLAPPGAQCQFIAGLFAAIAALEHNARSGEGPTPGLVDVSVLESLVATLIYDPVTYQFTGAIRQRFGNRFAAAHPLLATLQCKDGFVGLHSALHGMWVSLADLVGHPELVSDPRFATLLERMGHIEPLDRDYLLPWLAERTRWEAYHELQGRRIPSSAHPDMAEVLASPQLAAREFWRTARTPSGRNLKVPGPPARIRAEAGPAPNAGRTDGPWRPGALRVADLSMGWAGPMVTLNLAAMGADVIKIESHNHFDWWRGSRPPGDGEGQGLHERSTVFNTANRGKRGITLDLATDRGREVARDLIASADVLVENYGAGVIEKMGLTYDVLSDLNPRLIMLRQPGFGADGPESNYVVFGNTIEGMSGLSSLLGYEDGPPTMLSNACGDPVSGLGGTLAVLAALAGRERDGKGRLIECAQLEGFIPLVSESLIEYQRTGVVPPRRGDRRLGHTPSGAYHAGDDRWVVIDVVDDSAWASFANEIGESWATDPALATEPVRSSRRADLDGHIASWLSAVGAETALATCEDAGVAASLVLNESEVLGLEPLLANEFWQGMERDLVGFYLFPTIAYSMDGARPLPPCPAPFLGQHTDEVLEAMGFDARARAELAETGITGRLLVPAQ